MRKRLPRTDKTNLIAATWVPRSISTSNFKDLDLKGLSHFPTLRKAGTQQTTWKLFSSQMPLRPEGRKRVEAVWTQFYLLIKWWLEEDSSVLLIIQRTKKWPNRGSAKRGLLFQHLGECTAFWLRHRDNARSLDFITGTWGTKCWHPRDLFPRIGS